MSKDYWSDLIPIVDNGTTEVNVSHVFRGDEDVCLKMFGEQNEECIKHNAKPRTKSRRLLDTPLAI